MILRLSARSFAALSAGFSSSTAASSLQQHELWQHLQLLVETFKRAHSLAEDFQTLPVSCVQHSSVLPS